MKYLALIVLVLILVPVPVKALEFTAPAVPESGEEFMPNETESFSDGLWSIVKDAIHVIKPEAAASMHTCLSVVAIVIVCSIVRTMPGNSRIVAEFVSALMISLTLLQPSNALIRLAANTVVELCNYGKLLLPVLTASLAASGGATKSAALYTGAVAFNTALSAIISSIIVPCVYMFLCIATASCAIANNYLDKLKSFIKWMITWSMKTVLYIFTGFMAVTGVITGSVDASAVKAAKLTISGVVPVVGGLLSDASEAVLVGVGVLKNAAGVYGLLATIAIWTGPFIKTGVQYLLLKLCGSFCEVFAGKELCKLIEDYSSAMGFLLAMTGTVCVLLLISIVCFMKGVT